VPPTLGDSLREASLIGSIAWCNPCLRLWTCPHAWVQLSIKETSISKYFHSSWSCWPSVSSFWPL